MYPKHPAILMRKQSFAFHARQHVLAPLYWVALHATSPSVLLKPFCSCLDRPSPSSEIPCLCSGWPSKQTCLKAGCARPDQSK